MHPCDMDCFRMGVSTCRCRRVRLYCSRCSDYYRRSSGPCLDLCKDSARCIRMSDYHRHMASFFLLLLDSRVDNDRQRHDNNTNGCNANGHVYLPQLAVPSWGVGISRWWRRDLAVPG